MFNDFRYQWVGMTVFYEKTHSTRGPKRFTQISNAPDQAIRWTLIVNIKTEELSTSVWGGWKNYWLVKTTFNQIANWKDQMQK